MDSIPARLPEANAVLADDPAMAAAAYAACGFPVFPLHTIKDAGRRSIWARTSLLEARVPPRSRWRCDWDFDALTDDELEALMPLSEKQAAAEEAGIPAAWTPAELVLLERLGAKAGAPRRRGQ